MVFQQVSVWLRRYWRWLGVRVLGVLVIIFIVIQLFYPGSKLLPNASIDGVELGGVNKQAAAQTLTDQLSEKKIALYFGETASLYRTPTAKDIGIEVDNFARLEAHNYPWYLRLVPTSLLWYGTVQSDGEPTYQRNEKVLDDYIKEQLGSSCQVKPRNATLKAKDKKLEVVGSRAGGTCKASDVRQALFEVTPRLSQPTQVKIAMKPVPAAVSDETARKLAEDINQRTSGGVPLKVNASTVIIPGEAVLGWLSFKAVEQRLEYTIDPKKADAYLGKNVTPKVTTLAGTSKVTTRDFTEISRKNGANGQTLNNNATLASLAAYVDSKQDVASAITRVVAPKIDYTRTYTRTSTGLSALVRHYAEDHKGVYGIVFQELSGESRTAQYNSKNSFITASTYKLFVAYGTLKRVEKGEWKWSDDVTGGRDLATCFDDMIVKSDNACAEALLSKIGYKKLTDEIHEIGLVDSGFMGDRPRTTAYDLASFLVKLRDSRLPLKDSSQDRLIAVMKRNIYRTGIPAGTSGTVADKVGFLDGLLHDAGIVYSSKGHYVLVIMSDGSAWANIAELTRKIEALR